MQGVSERGIVIATLAMAGWGAIVAVNRVVVTYFAFNPLLYTILAFIFAGLGLLLIGGVKQRGLAVLKHPHSWTYGLLRVPHFMLINAALLGLTGVEFMLIERVSVIFVVAMTWVFLNRPPHKQDYPLLLLTLLGALLVVSQQVDGFLNWAVWLTFGAAALNAALAIIGELHPESNKALGLRARATYTGAVLLVTALVFFVLLIALTVAYQYFGWAVLASVLVPPSWAMYGQTELYLLSAAIGLLLYAPTMYLTFLAFRLIKADNTLMLGTLIPITTLGFESLFNAFGWLDMRSFTVLDLLAGLIIVIGAVLTVMLRWSRAQKPETAEDLLK